MKARTCDKLRFTETIQLNTGKLNSVKGIGSFCLTRKSARFENNTGKRVLQLVLPVEVRLYLCIKVRLL